MSEIAGGFGGERDSLSRIQDGGRRTSRMGEV